MIAIPANDVYNLTVAALVIGAAVLWCCAFVFYAWCEGRLSFDCGENGAEGGVGRGGVERGGDGGGGDGGDGGDGG